MAVYHQVRFPTGPLFRYPIRPGRGYFDIVIAGLVIALIGELSWLDILFPGALPLIPLTRFPGFIWLIAAGFILPSVRDRAPVSPE